MRGGGSKRRRPAALGDGPRDDPTPKAEREAVPHPVPRAAPAPGAGGPRGAAGCAGPCAPTGARRRGRRSANRGRATIVASPATKDAVRQRCSRRRTALADRSGAPPASRATAAHTTQASAGSPVQSKGRVGPDARLRPGRGSPRRSRRCPRAAPSRRPRRRAPPGRSVPVVPVAQPVANSDLHPVHGRQHEDGEQERPADEDARVATVRRPEPEVSRIRTPAPRTRPGRAPARARPRPPATRAPCARPRRVGERRGARREQDHDRGPVGLGRIDPAGRQSAGVVERAQVEVGEHERRGRTGSSRRRAPARRSTGSARGPPAARRAARRLRLLGGLVSWHPVRLCRARRPAPRGSWRRRRSRRSRRGRSRSTGIRSKLCTGTGVGSCHSSDFELPRVRLRRSCAR